MARKKNEEAEESTGSNRTIRGFSRSARLYFGQDEEDNKYGPKNNPRREGSAKAEDFLKIKEGMTIQKALDAGVSSGFIGKSIDKGHLVVEEDEAQQAA